MVCAHTRRPARDSDCTGKACGLISRRPVRRLGADNNLSELDPTMLAGV